MKYFLTTISIFGLAITLSAEKNPKSKINKIILSMFYKTFHCKRLKFQ